MSQQKKRNRLFIGRLVASSNQLRNIQGKRLNIVVKYAQDALFPRVVSQEVIGVRVNPYL